jgi:hypothetical protein
VQAVAAGLAALAFLIGSLLVISYGSWPGFRPWRTSIPLHIWLNAAQGTSAALAILAAAWIVWGAGRLTTRLAVSAVALALVILLWQVIVRVPRDLAPVRATFSASG